MSQYNQIFNSIFNKYTRLIVLIVWSLLLGVGVYYGPLFLSNCNADIIPSKSSESMISLKAYVDAFGDIAKGSNALFILSTLNNSNVRDNYMSYNVVTELTSKILNSNYHPYVSVPLSYYNYTYNSFVELFIGAQLISKDETMMLITTIFDDSPNNIESTTSAKLATFQRDLCDDINNNLLRNGEFNLLLQTTGPVVLLDDVTRGSNKDLTTKDIYTFPIALLVLLYVLKSWRLMIIPCCTLGISIAVSFLIMYPISLIWNIVAFAPPIMMSVILALSVDYSLFLLTRFRSEFQRTNDANEAVIMMFRHAGRVVLVSGSTLALTFIALICFPFSFLQTIGTGVSISIIITIFVNLTFTPSILLTFPEFFSTETYCESYLNEKVTKDPASEAEYTHVATNSKYLLTYAELSSDTESGISSIYDTFWHRSARFFTKTKFHSIFLILLVFGLFAPLSYQLLYFKVTIDTAQIFPSNAASNIALQDVTDKFSAGIVSPYSAIIVNKNSITNSILTEAAFNLTHRLCIGFLKIESLNPESLVSIAYSQDKLIVDLEQAQDLLSNNSTNPLSPLYQVIFRKVTNELNSSTYIQIITPFPPMGDQATDFTKQIRQIIDDIAKTQSEFEIYFAGEGAEMVDAVIMVMMYFPYVIGITCLVIFMGVGIIYKSIYFPIRLVLSIVVPLSAVYGACWLIFGAHKLAFMLPSLNDIDNIYWLTPVMSFSILIGLALDYDLFLYSRVVEFRTKGFCTRASVVLGMGHTGGIITAAGIIMAIAFSGLMLSSSFALQEIGFMLTCSVLVDTFIIRTMLVPALIHLAEEYNWYPRDMPMLSRQSQEPFIIGY